MALTYILCDTKYLRPRLYFNACIKLSAEVLKSCWVLPALYNADPMPTPSMYPCLYARGIPPHTPYVLCQQCNGTYLHTM